MGLRGAGDKSIELPTGKITYSRRAGADLLKIFNAIINFNNGEYQSEQQFDFVEATIEEDGKDFTYETSEYEVEQLLENTISYRHLVLVGGRWLPNGEEKPIPICRVYLLNMSGVIERYNCKFKLTNKRKWLRDYELDSLELVWSRKEGKIKKEE